MSTDRALVATTDFFTPIVDDPAAWGAIACANALSDVYAMGGTPLFALNLVAWPRETLSLDLLGLVLEGAARVAQGAGCPIVGGHSIDDPEPKYGLAVIGEVHPDRMMTTSGGRPGDVLVLTKPIGTGILTTALKKGILGEPELAGAIDLMQVLNRDAARVAREHGVGTATDVTGFGLLGHLGNILAASGLAAALDFDAVPLLAGAADLARDGVVPGGTRRNLEAAEIAGTKWDGLTDAERLLCADAQTSGGLLLAVPPDTVESLVAGLEAAATPASAVIGRLVEGRPGSVLIRRQGGGSAT